MTAKQPSILNIGLVGGGDFCREILEKIPFVQDIRDDYVAGSPTVKVRVDRQRAALLGPRFELPVLADCQFAALVCGAHPYKIVQSHWHASSTETLMEKLGIDWQAKKAEFEAYLKDVEAGLGQREGFGRRRRPTRP